MIRKLMLMVGSAMLMLGTIVLPAAAQGGDAVLGFLNGVPGQRLDICVVYSDHRDEVVSSLRYARFSPLMALAPGDWTLQARVASTGNCRGKVLTTKTVTLGTDKNDTMVFWTPRSAVTAKLFENDLGVPSAETPTLTMRHTAKAGPIDVWVWLHVEVASRNDPTFEDLQKGAASPIARVPDGEVLINAFPATRTSAWSWEALWVSLPGGSAAQAYLIGTERSNYRIVAISQPGVVTP